MDQVFFSSFDVHDPAQLAEFVDQNALFHQNAHDGIMAQKGLATEMYPLFTDGRIDQDWLDLNYKEIVAWSTALTLPLPTDLSEVDFNDPDDTYSWQNDLSLFYNQVSQSLGQ